MASQDGPSQQPAAVPEITDSGSSSKVVDVVHVMNVTLTEANDHQQIRDELFDNVMDGDWDAVVGIYTEHKIIVQTAMITKSKETALHIAIMDNNTEAAKKLLDLVDDKKIKDMKNERENNPLHLAAARGQVEICKRMMEKDETLIGARNKDGETPLFHAALHGKKGAFYSLHPKCSISGLNIVHDISHCRRNLDGNSILHVAILGEYFELAYQIMHWYPELSEKRSKNEKGHSPLEFLAKNPSAFRSGCHLGPLDDFIYKCSTVEHLNREFPSDFKEQSPEPTFHIPENYRACFDLFQISQKATKVFFSSPNQLEAQREKGDKDVEKQSSPVQSKCLPKLPKGKDKEKHVEQVEIPHDTILCQHLHLKVGENTNKGDSKKRGRARKVLPDSTQAYPPNYSTFFEFLEFMMELFLFVLGLGFFKVHKIKEVKRKHTWTVQVMQELVSQAGVWEYEETGSQPPDLEEFRTGGISLEESSVPQTDDEHKPEANMTNQGQAIGAGANPKQAENAKDDSKKGATTTKQREENMISNPLNSQRSEKDNQIQNVANERTRSNEDKVQEGKEEKSPILVAAKTGVTEMVEEILEIYPVAIEDENQDEKNVVLLAVENRQPRVYTFLKNKYATNESIFQKVDKDGNSALHLAATLGSYRPWMIPGAALQMQWELKWFEFINVSMPRHFFTRLNKNGRTAKEVFVETHKELVKDGGTWLTNTSQSCSVVAALIATVAFASATTVPGGVKEGRGTPTLEGKPAFDVFAISSLVALCFSVTSLTMFLSILTSRYQVEDFRYSLPTKLILGLTSLFVSIAAMLVAFCAGHFFLLAESLKYAAFPVYAITCLPVTLFAVAQFPLYLDLLKSTMAPVPKRSYEVISI